jgi:8-oxo-dGTP pyrophosphatase MutT (NUDIX family)
VEKSDGDKYFAGGFLVHPASRKVLLQFRGSRTPHDPDTWCIFGGWREDEDGGDPVATWRREMREELGAVIDPTLVVPLCDYAPSGNPYHRYIFYCEWPAPAVDFVLAEDEEDLGGYGWFTVEAALALPNLQGDGTRRDLALFRERLGPPTAE